MDFSNHQRETVYDQGLVSSHMEDEHNKLLDRKKMLKPLKIYSCKSIKI